MLVEEPEAKQLISVGGIAIPSGIIATTADAAYGAAIELLAERPGAVIVKAQALNGGPCRGGVRCESPTDAREFADQVLGSGPEACPINRVLVEAAVDVAHELYVAVTIDAAAATPVVVLSTTRFEIEDVGAASALDGPQIVPIGIGTGLGAGQAMDIAVSSGVEPAVQVGLAGLLITLYGLFRQYDAELLEISPLAITSTHDLVALDCKLVVDDRALFRQTAVREVVANAEAAR